MFAVILVGLPSLSLQLVRCVWAVSVCFQAGCVEPLVFPPSVVADVKLAQLGRRGSRL